MNTNPENDKYKVMVNSLRENMRMTELSLITFNDEMKRLLLQQIQQPNLSPDFINRFNLDITLLSETQSNYAKFKASVDVITALTVH